MTLDLTKINDTLDTLISDIALLENHIDDIKKVKYQTIPLLREIKEENDKISAERNKSPQNKTYISSLCDQELTLQQKYRLTSNLETKLTEGMDTMYQFLQKFHHKKDFIDKITDAEIKIVNELYNLNTPQSLSKIRPTLVEYLDKVADVDLIELINTKCKLTGYKRFYLEQDMIKSFYVDDLRSLLHGVLVKDNFAGLINIVQDVYGVQKSLKPIQILQSIITYHNKRKIK